MLVIQDMHHVRQIDLLQYAKMVYHAYEIHVRRNVMQILIHHVTSEISLNALLFYLKYIFFELLKCIERHNANIIINKFFVI